MKKLLILAVAISGACSAKCQSGPAIRATISQVSGRERLVFSVSTEANVRYYRIEAGTDSSQLRVIGAVTSKGNSVHGRTYNLDLEGQANRYYRVVAVNMNGGMPSSNIVTTYVKKGSERSDIMEIPGAAVLVNK